MKSIFLIITLFVSFSASALEPWKYRMYCYGTMFSGNDFTVEVEQSHDDEGLFRNVYFAKNVDAGEILVTDECRKVGKNLICESDKVKVVIDVENRYSHTGMWQAADYNYYEATVTKYGLFFDKTETIRCR